MKFAVRVSKGLIFSLFIFFQINNVLADSLCNGKLRGINLAGAEFLPEVLPGVAGKDYRFPSASNVQYFSKSGFNAVRLPLLWERLQPVLFGELDREYSQYLLNYMDYAKQSGQLVVIDIHNYGRYRNKDVGSSDVPKEAFRDLWKKIAVLLKYQPSLYAYGLMNEPHYLKGRWPIIAQVAVDGIREVDSNHYIYVAGSNWSGASSWPKDNPEPFINDVANKVIYEAHVYFDDDFSGRYQKTTVDYEFETRIETRLRPFLTWLKIYKQKGVVGEWGVPANDPIFKNSINAFLATTDSECLDWYVWAGGQWSKSYRLSLDPVDGQEKYLLRTIKSHLMKVD